jgi:ATP-binding cassette subfamily B (MDR/TAP) protein 1
MIGQNIGLILMLIGDLIASCVLALAIYWKLALVAIFGCMPPLLLAGFLHMRFDRYAQDRCARYFLESTRFTAESIAAIRTVSAFGLESRIVERYSTRLDMAVTASAKASFWSMLFFSLSDSLDFLGLWRRSESFLLWQ